MTVVNELEMMRKEVVKTYCKMLPQNLQGGTEVTHKESHCNPCPHSYSKRSPPGNKLEVTPLWQSSQSRFIYICIQIHLHSFLYLYSHL
jgi:hypothetical protein